LPALALVLLSAAGLSPRWVPFSMDEFVHFHALGCQVFPLEQASMPGLEACGSYDMRPPLLPWPLPLRSYRYIGSLPAWLFAPAWALARAPWVARVQGALCFLGSVALAAHLARARRSSALLAALLLPVYLGSFVVDIGPVGPSLLALLGALASLRRALSRAAPGRAAAWGALAGLLVFAGIWTKLVFVWVLPGLVLVTLAGLRDAEPAIGPGRRSALLACAAAAALPTAVPDAVYRRA
jgi:hypothetical protein